MGIAFVYTYKSKDNSVWTIKKINLQHFQEGQKQIIYKYFPSFIAFPFYLEI